MSKKSATMVTVSVMTLITIFIFLFANAMPDYLGDFRIFLFVVGLISGVKTLTLTVK
jgi:hypothetical protein